MLLNLLPLKNRYIIMMGGSELTKRMDGLGRESYATFSYSIVIYIHMNYLPIHKNFAAGIRGKLHKFSMTCEPKKASNKSTPLSS